MIPVLVGFALGAIAAWPFAWGCGWVAAHEARDRRDQDVARVVSEAKATLDARLRRSDAVADRASRS